MWSNIILTKGVGEDGEPDTTFHPPSRYKHCGVLVPTPPSNSNYDLYIFGGRSGTFPLKDFWKLDLKRGAWEEIRNGEGSSGEWPPHLQEHSMVVYSQQIYIFGGEISLSYGEDLSPLWIYAVESKEWRRWGCPSDDNSDPSDKGNRMKKKQMMMKSPELSRQSLTKTPVGRRGHTATVWNNYMLIYGGYRDLKGSLGDLWAFHFETESWHLFSSHDLHKKNAKPWYFSFNSSSSNSTAFPCPRHSHIAALHNGNHLYVHGGMQDLVELGDLWKFDLKGRYWTQIKTKYGPGPLHGHVGMVALESLLILAGERGGKAVDEFWRFDFLGEGWERIVLNGCRPCPRIWPWGTILPMVYKRVQGNPSHSGGNGMSNNAQASPGSTEENKYWWDYDESMTARPEEYDEDDDDMEQVLHPPPITTATIKGNASTTNGNSSSAAPTSTTTRSSLFSDFTRFASYQHNDYQALSESNSVCLSEEEASPRPLSSSKSKSQQAANAAAANANQCQNQEKLELPGLKKIEEQESHPPPLIDLGDGDDYYPASAPPQNHPSSTENSNSSSPEETTFDPIVDSSIATTNSYSSSSNSTSGSRPSNSSTRRSESATCLQLNMKKNSVKKSASVRFADLQEPPSTSSSSHFILGRECTSDYSSMEHGMNSLQLQQSQQGGRSIGGPTGFENPNYHGSGTSSLFNHHNFHQHQHPQQHGPNSSKVVEAYELGSMTRSVSNNEEKVLGPGTTMASASSIAVTVTAAAAGKEQEASPTPYYYQVSTPNYMLLIGGNESHSSQVVSKRQPLAIWRLRVTRDLFAAGQNPGTSGNGGDFSYNSGGGNGSGNGRPSSGSQRKVTLASTTGF